MKLFGNRRSGGRAASRKEAAQARRTHDAAQPSVMLSPKNAIFLFFSSMKAYP